MKCEITPELKPFYDLVENEYMFYLYYLDIVNDQNEHAASACGCPNCKGQATLSAARLMDEYDRQVKYQPDHEEDYITNKALAKLDDRTNL